MQVFLEHSAEVVDARGKGGSPPVGERERILRIPFSAIDVHVPTNDGRELLFTRYTQPESELRLLIDKLRLVLPVQPLPRISVAAADSPSPT